MLVSLSEIFEIRYGNQFDLSKMDTCDKNHESSIAFVGRSSANNGVVSYVRDFNDIQPFNPGSITVAMGGSILASFVQQRSFYTAQNVKVLTPKTNLSLNQNLYYCTAIQANRFRYSAFGREANSTFNEIKVPLPSEIPTQIKQYQPKKNISPKPVIVESMQLKTDSWQWFIYSDLFEILTSKDDNLVDALDGETPYISSTQMQNGISQWINSEPTHDSNTVTVARNGSVASAFFHPYAYSASPDDVRIFKPKFNMNKYIAMFLITLIEKEKYRYAYGRKFGTKRMQSSKIKLPVNKAEQPDWDFMEHFIKALPYSSNL